MAAGAAPSLQLGGAAAQQCEQVWRFELPGGQRWALWVLAAADEGSGETVSAADG